MTDDRTRLADALASASPLTWVLTGDSITHGLIHTRGARNYVDHLHELIRGDANRVHDVVINTAVTGSRADLILADFDRRVADWRPDVVTLMIGTNDCTTTWLDQVIESSSFRDTVAELGQRVRALDAIPVLQTPPTVDLMHAPDRDRIGEFAQAIRAVADEHDMILADQHAAFAAFSAGTGPGNDGTPWGLLDDALHPNAAGHAVIALGLVRALELDRDVAGSRVISDLTARVALARHPHWPPAPADKGRDGSTRRKEIV